MSHKGSLRRLLFVGEEVTLAHVTRPLVLASALDHNKFEILFACGDRYKALIKTAGYKVFSLPSISSDTFLERLAKGEPIYTYNELEEYINAEINLFSEISPDLIIGDFRISLGITADILKVPYISLSNAHWSPYSTQPFPIPEHKLVKILGIGITKIFLPKVLPFIFWHHARSFNTLRKSFGLSPVGNLRHMYTHGTWSLYTDIPSIAPTNKLPSNHKYIGPVLWSPDIPLPEWWNELPEHKIIIYITMGSSGDTNLLKHIIEALKNTSFVSVVATAGRIRINSSSNIFVADYLPGLKVIEQASAVICNGGNATAYQALSLGVPVLGFPSNADQFFTMASIQRNGAGILLRPVEVSKEKIKQAVNNIVYNKKIKNSAEKLAKEISFYDAKKLFANFITDWSEGIFKTN